MKRFLWLATALLMAAAMLVYLQARLPMEASAGTPRDAGTARPAGDRQALVSGLFQGALLNAVDGQDFAETGSYRRLLYHVRAMSPEDFSSRVTGWLDWEDAVAHPERWRGEFVRVRGVVARLEATRLQGLDAGIEDVYRGFIFEPDGSEAVVFDYVDKPPKLRVEEAVKDTLEIEGIFYRTVRYEAAPSESASGQVVPGPIREIPYLIARKLTVLQVQSTAQSPWIVGLKVLGVVIASVVVALVASRWGGRRSTQRGAQTGFREMFEARLRDGGDRPGHGPKTS